MTKEIRALSDAYRARLEAAFTSRPLTSLAAHQEWEALNTRRTTVRAGRAALHDTYLRLITQTETLFPDLSTEARLALAEAASHFRLAEQEMRLDLARLDTRLAAMITVFGSDA